MEAPRAVGGCNEKEWFLFYGCGLIANHKLAEINSKNEQKSKLIKNLRSGRTIIAEVKLKPERQIATKQKLETVNIMQATEKVTNKTAQNLEITKINAKTKQMLKTVKITTNTEIKIETLKTEPKLETAKTEPKLETAKTEQNLETAKTEQKLETAKILAKTELKLEASKIEKKLEDVKFKPQAEKGNGDAIQGGEQQQGGAKSKKTRKNFPKEARNVLIQWLRENKHHPYPTYLEKLDLVEATKLSLVQVNYWFINGRRRELLKILKENVATPTSSTKPSIEDSPRTPK